MTAALTTAPDRIVPAVVLTIPFSGGTLRVRVALEEMPLAQATFEARILEFSLIDESVGMSTMALNEGSFSIGLDNANTVTAS